MDKLFTNFLWLYNLFQQCHDTIRRSDKFCAGTWKDLAIEQFLMRSVKSGGGITRGCTMIESVLMLGVLQGRKSAEVHEATAEISGLKYRTSKQHVELGTSRKSNSFIDLMKTIHWLPTFDTFSLTDPNFYNQVNVHQKSTVKMVKRLV